MAIFDSSTIFTDHMLRGSHFTIFTDHKPLIFAFKQKPEKFLPHQTRHLSFISEFTHDYEALARSQEHNPEMKRYLESDTSLKITNIKLPETNIELYCDFSTAIARPNVTEPLP